MKGYVKAICISERKGVRKHTVPSAELIADYGLAGDAHAGAWHRQVSLLADESVDTMRPDLPGLAAGDFAENILTAGLELKALPIGSLLRVGETELEVTQIGKECHSDCEIRRLTGKCVMPTDGIFAIVKKGGMIRPGDTVETVRETV